VINYQEDGGGEPLRVVGAAGSYTPTDVGSMWMAMQGVPRDGRWRVIDESWNATRPELVRVERALDRRIYTRGLITDELMLFVTVWHGIVFRWSRRPIREKDLQERRTMRRALRAMAERRTGKRGWRRGPRKERKERKERKGHK